MDEQQFKQLSNKMDAIIRLLALNAVEGKQLKDQASILCSFGFQPSARASWRKTTNLNPDFAGMGRIGDNFRGREA
jgi:hypothetical protein